MRVNSFSQERATIEEYITSNFDTFVTPIKFDNVDFLIKGGVTVTDATRESVWVRFTIQNDDNVNTIIGNKRSRISGAVQASIFVREREGTVLLRKVADEIYELLANRSVNGIEFNTSVLTPLPAQDGWYQLVLTTDYYWDKCPA